MSVAEIRTKISLDSKDTARALEELARSVKTFDNALGGAKGSFKSIDSAIKSTNTNIMTLTKSILIAENSLHSLEKFGNMLGTLFKGAYDYTTVLESNAVGMSGILTSMTTLNGKTLEWNKAMSISKDIMKELRETALQTASTAPELIDTFRALLGPAMGTGMNVKQVMELTTVGVNAVKSMGLGGVQLVQELRSIIQGSIKPASSTLATALGISNTDVKNAINSSEGLFNFLMKKLKGFEMSVGETTKTIRGRIDVLTEAFYQTVEKSSENVFGTIKQSLQNLTDIMLVFNNETKRFELNPAFIEQMKTISDLVNSVLITVTDIGRKLLQNISGIVDAFSLFIKTEALVGGVGLLIVGLGKFRDILVNARNSMQGLVECSFNILKNEQSVEAIENEILEKIKAKKNVTNDIENYNKSVVKSIENEIKNQKKVNNELEKQRNLVFEIDRKFNTLYTSQNILPVKNVINKANEIRSMGRMNGMSENDINVWLNQYLTEYEKHGAKHAEVYFNAFKNNFKRFNLSDEIKMLMQKNANDFNGKDVFAMLSARNKIIDPSQLQLMKQYDEAFYKLTETMRKAGITQSVVAQEFVQGNKAIVASGGDVVKLTERLTVAQIENTTRAIENNLAKQNVIKGLMSLGGMLTTVGFAYQMLTNDTESNIGVMAEWAIKAGTVIAAMGQVGTAMRELIVIAKELNMVLGIQNLLKLGSTHPYVMAAIGLGALAYGGYKLHGMIQEDSKQFKEWRDLEKRTSKYTSNLVYNDAPMQDDIANEEAMNKARNSSNIPKYTDLKTAGSVSGNSGSNKGAKRLQEQADKAKRSYDELIASINVANAKFDTDSDSFAKKQAEINKQITQWQNKLDEANQKGNFTEKEIENANNLIAKYRELAEAENERNKQKQWYADELQRINNLQAMGILTENEVNVRRIGTLSQEIDFLKQMLPLYKNNAEGRLQIENDIAQRIKAIREAELTDGTVHWDRVLEHIRNTSYNLTETINSGVSGMFDSIANFGQNLLTESKSLSQRFKDLFKNLANDLMNMMMKVIMRGLIMNAILGIGGNSKYYTKGELDPMKVTGAKIGTRAKGGLASGWNIVGENGPELVNFSNPARVYTAQQTRNALNASGGNVNIKIDLKNESGQELQAEQTGSTFDGENYVLGIVLKAISTNKGGIRNIMKGVATT